MWGGYISLTFACTVQISICTWNVLTLQGGITVHISFWNILLQQKLEIIFILTLQEGTTEHIYIFLPDFEVSSPMACSYLAL